MGSNRAPTIAANMKTAARGHAGGTLVKNTEDDLGRRDKRFALLFPAPYSVDVKIWAIAKYGSWKRFVCAACIEKLARDGEMYLAKKLVEHMGKTQKGEDKTVAKHRETWYRNNAKRAQAEWLKRRLAQQVREEFENNGTKPDYGDPGYFDAGQAGGTTPAESSSSPQLPDRAATPFATSGWLRR